MLILSSRARCNETHLPRDLVANQNEKKPQGHVAIVRSCASPFPVKSSVGLNPHTTVQPKVKDQKPPALSIRVRQQAISREVDQYTAMGMFNHLHSLDYRISQRSFETFAFFSCSQSIPLTIHKSQVSTWTATMCGAATARLPRATTST